MDKLVRGVDDLIATVESAVPNPYKIVDYGDSLAAELLIIGLRALYAIRCLMAETIEGPHDHTEEAATLMRKILETFALLVWIRDEGDDQNVQALRVELTDVRQQLTAARDVVASEDGEAADERLLEIEATAKSLEDELEARGAQAKQRDSTYDILKKKHLDYAIRWRFESSAAHGALMGRHLQRRETVIGVPADEARRENVLVLSISLFGGLAHRAFSVMAENSDDEVGASLKSGMEALDRLSDAQARAGLFQSE